MFVIQNLHVVILKLGIKVCSLWKYYFNLTNYVQFGNFHKLDVLRYWLSTDNISSIYYAHIFANKPIFCILLLDLFCPELVKYRLIVAYAVLLKILIYFNFHLNFADVSKITLLEYVAYYLSVSLNCLHFRFDFGHFDKFHLI